MLTDFGKFLRKLRIDRGELIKNMAEKLGITASYLSAVETGKRNIPDTWISAISSLYSLSNGEAQELKDAAANSSRSVTMTLEDTPCERRETALLFAREFQNMDDSTINRIRNLIKNPKNEM
jgi:transcriptional regulator with XRE-family HTH domain